jgi:phosphomevalonate kinase
MLADVDAGSDTPSLVGKVLKWRKDKAEEGQYNIISFIFDSSFVEMFSLIAEALWKHLDQLNQSLARTLLHLSKLHDQDPVNYKSAVKYISTLQPLQWEANPLQPPAEQPTVNTFYQAHIISQAGKTTILLWTMLNVCYAGDSI